MTIEYLPRTLVVELMTLAQQSPQREICGLISESTQGVHRLFPIDNISATAETLFEMEPKQLIDAMREMRQTGTPLKAIYHSHLSSEAIPSQRDLLDANYPEALYLILSLNTEGVLELRGFRLQDDQFNAVTLETTDYVDQR